jgi:hypothetical protein
MSPPVRPLLTLTLLAVLGSAVTGCGATKKVVVNVRTTPLRTVKVLGSTATIPNVPTGTRIICRGWKRAVKVPPPGSEANVGQGRATPSGKASSSKSMQLTHLPNGSVTVTCSSLRAGSG